jgi:hypothetical protein
MSISAATLRCELPRRWDYSRDFLCSELHSHADHVHWNRTALGPILFPTLEWHSFRSSEGNHPLPFQIEREIPHLSEAKIHATPFEWRQSLWNNSQPLGNSEGKLNLLSCSTSYIPRKWHISLNQRSACDQNRISSRRSTRLGHL